MSSVDPVLDLFADLQPDYPGKARIPVNRKVAELETVEWDAKPVHYFVGGVEKEFFTIGHLADALDCSVQSIRGWERAGLLPRSGFRSPSPRRGTISTKGKRLWTRRQIEIILGLCASEGVIINKQPPTREFALKVFRAFEALDHHA